MIDTAWLDDTDEKTYGIDDVDLNIWGDWGYGGEGTEYDPTMQYGDPRLEEPNGFLEDAAQPSITYIW